MPEFTSPVDLAFQRLRSASPETLDEERKSPDAVHAAIAALFLDLRRGSAGNLEKATPSPASSSRYNIR